MTKMRPARPVTTSGYGCSRRAKGQTKSLRPNCCRETWESRSHIVIAKWCSAHFLRRISPGCCQLHGGLCHPPASSSLHGGGLASTLSPTLASMPLPFLMDSFFFFEMSTTNEGPKSRAGEATGGALLVLALDCNLVYSSACLERGGHNRDTWPSRTTRLRIATVPSSAFHLFEILFFMGGFAQSLSPCLQGISDGACDVGIWCLVFMDSTWSGGSDPCSRFMDLFGRRRALLAKL